MLGSLVALDSVLEPLGQRRVQVLFGERALERPLHEGVACVLLDVRVPGVDGFEGEWGSGRGRPGRLDGADASTL